MTVMSMSDYEMTLEFPVVITKFLRSMKGGYLIKRLVIIPDQLNYYCNKTDIQEYSGAV